ncbi:solute carrier family 35 member G1 [Brachionus plicatilis]|uniref:Solute carrier family 35 member G1 n=1 Tax=Brachionus plicatilis TaxID=10195 RepID=A0A3M7QKC1_BRAPC|nr:solute carrier family 35 member G1 [Brachionus plicatilis]
MSFKSTQENNAENDEDSLVELGEFAIISSSKASLRYRSAHSLNQKAHIQHDPASSKLIENNQDLDTSVPESDSFFGRTKTLIFLPYRGYFYGLFSAFFFCLSQIFLRRAKWLSAADHATIRYFFTFITMTIFVKYHQMNMFGPKKQLSLLLIRGLVGYFSLMSVYFALMLINPSDVVSLAHASLIITAIMSRIFLKEKLTIAHVFSIFLTAVGVLFISKPSFIFGTKQMVQILNRTNTSQNAEPSFEDYKIPIGVSMTFLAAIFTSVIFLILKKLSNSKVHWAYSTICVTWFGLPLSFTLSSVLVLFGFYHKDLSIEQQELPMDIFYSSVAASTSLLGQIFLNIAFKYEDATKIAITKTIDMFFSFLLQYLLLDIMVDSWSIFGAIAILIGTFAVLLFRLFEDKYKNLNIEMENTTKEMEEKSNLATDVDSLIEVSDIAILSSSKASLHYQSFNQRHIFKEQDPSSHTFLERNESCEDKSEGLLNNFNYYAFLPYCGAKWFSAADHATIRYSSAFLVMSIFLKSKGMNLTGPKKQYKLILFRGFIGSVCLLSIYFAVMLINPSDVVSLTHTSLIITAIMSRIFLKEKLTIAHVSSIFLTAIGVMCITKPSFLFPLEPNQLFNSTNVTKIYENKIEEYKLPIGISMTFFASFLTSGIYLLLKKLSNSKVHWAYSTICISWFGFPLSLTLSIVLTWFGFYHKNFAEEKSEIFIDVFYSLAASGCSLLGQIFLNISFKYEDATKIAITKTTDVFFSFLLQYFFLHIFVDKWKIIGAISILTGTFIVLIFKLFEEQHTKSKMTVEINGKNESSGKKSKRSIKESLIKIIVFKF